ncbi:MAG: hypothetical protein J3K34DRAFT_456979 [Monoraphidium minutum]|nr:MAG: hypothetical protein J3K34DRAFT_456979 [Monoraphidium minutum]
MFSTPPSQSPPPALPVPTSASGALAHAGAPALGGAAAADGMGAYPQYAGSLYAMQQGMGALALDGWGAAAAAAAAGGPFGNYAMLGCGGGAEPPGQGALMMVGGGGGGVMLSGSPASSAILQDDSRTISIAGFPSDVRDRELHNLLRYLPGYEACQLARRGNGGEPQGLALFASPSAARFAADLVSATQFDDDAAPLRAELALTNMAFKADDPSIKRAPHPSPFSTPAALAAAAAAAAAGAPPPPGSPGSSTAAPAAALAAAAPGGASGLLPGSPRRGGDGSPAGGAARAFKMPLRPQSFSPVTNLRDNPPCNTLFIGNLGDSVSEAEMRALFSSQPGYRQMKIVKGGRNTTAFVEFASVGGAMLTHQALQGAVLASSDRGGVRLQFSKNPFGRRDDCPRDQSDAPPPAAAAAAAAAAAMTAAAAAGAGAGGAAALQPLGIGLGAAGGLGGMSLSQLPGMGWASALPYDHHAAAAGQQLLLPHQNVFAAIQGFAFPHQGVPPGL